MGETLWTLSTIMGRRGLLDYERELLAEKNAESLLVIKDAPELVKASSAAPMAQASGDIHGNRHGKVYRVPGCKSYAGMRPASVVPFATETEAQQAGYRKAKDCP
jgi:deoxyribonuclease-1